ncbi:MAG: hypothetical protein RBT68_02380 [Spirochaetia bacterium]|jgi:uncharacterized protein (TIGR03545 family)|nr:hypothetical protein [Spirochaetia bacterium]
MSSNKTVRVPALFRKAIAEKDFEKKYLRFIEQTMDKDLLRSSFILKDGSYRLKDGLDAASLKKLGMLAKAIKANRGMVKAGPLTLSAVLAAGLAVFAVFFMNPLLEGAVERGLSDVFEAQAEVAGFRLDPVRMRVGIASVAVADRDKPMTNLLEAGRVELRLNPAALLRGKVYIEEASAASVLFGTARSVSGALPAYQSKEKAGKPAMEAGAPLVDLENFSAQALLDREKAKLESTQAYEDAAAAYTEASDRWNDRSVAATQALAELRTSTSAVLAIDVKNLKSADAVSAAIQDVRSASSSARTVGQQSGDIVKGLQADIDAAAALEKQARSAAAEDLERLKSYMDPKSGAAMEALEPSIKEILSDSAERYLDYGLRALEVAGKLKKDGSKDPEAAETVSARGRDVRYQASAYPAFRLGLFGADFSVDGTKWQIILKELSSDPDLVPQPLSLALSVASPAHELAFSGIADLRAAARELFVVEASGAGVPVDLGTALEEAGIGGFTGTAAFTLEASGSGSGSVAAQSAISIADGRVLDPTGGLARALADAMETVGSVELGVGYDQEGNEPPKFSVTTNLNDLVAAALAATADRYAKQAEAELDAAFRKYTGTELEGKLGAKDSAEALLGAAKGDKAAADRLGTSLDAKKVELENRAAALAKDAAAGVIKNVEIPTFNF